MALAKRVNEMVARFPEQGFHDRILAFCRSELPSARIFESKAQNATHVVTSTLGPEDARKLFDFVSRLDAEFRVSSEHFIDAAIERHFRGLQTEEERHRNRSRAHA